MQMNWIRLLLKQSNIWESNSLIHAVQKRITYAYYKMPSYVNPA